VEVRLSSQQLELTAPAILKTNVTRSRSIHLHGRFRAPFAAYWNQKDSCIGPDCIPDAGKQSEIPEANLREQTYEIDFLGE
jgi:hypothetical protein